MLPDRAPKMLPNRIPQQSISTFSGDFDGRFGQS